MGTWRIFSIFFDDAVPDYPGLGTSTDKIAVSGNVFALAAGGGLYGCHIDGSPAGFIASDVEVMAWSEMLGGGPVDLESFNGVATFPGSYITWRPALQTPATSATLSLVAYDGDEWQHPVRSRDGFARWLERELDVGDHGPDGCGDPAGAQCRRATATPAATGYADDDRRRRGRATDRRDLAERPPDHGLDVCVRCGSRHRPIEIASGSASSTRARARPPPVQDFFIGEDDKDLYMGGVGYAGNGDLHISWTRSSAVGNDYPSSYITRQPAAVLAGELAADDGTGPYGTLTGDGHRHVSPARAGATTSASPRTRRFPNAVWQANQFSTGGSYWATNGLAAPDRRRHVRPDRSTAGPRQSRQPRRDRHLQREHAQVVHGRRIHVVRRHDPGRRDRGDRQRDGGRPDRERLRLGHHDPDEHPRLVDPQLPGQGHAGQQRDRPCRLERQAVRRLQGGRRQEGPHHLRRHRLLPARHRGRRLQHARPDPGPRQPGGLRDRPDRPVPHRCATPARDRRQP